LGKQVVVPIKAYEGSIDEERRAFLESNLTYRRKQLLDLLELLGGDITDKNPYIVLSRLAEDSGVTIKTFQAAASHLEVLGLVGQEKTKEHIKIALTDLGRECIAQLKALPEFLEKLERSKPKELFRNGTSLQILEYINVNAGFTDENNTLWLRNFDSSPESLVNLLSKEIGVSEMTISVMLHALDSYKGYVERRKFNNGHSKTPTNIGITEQGSAYLQRAHEALRLREESPNNKLIEQAMSLTRTVVNLAKVTGASQLVEQLDDKNDIEWLKKLSLVDLEEHVFWLGRKFQELRGHFSFDMSDPANQPK
jgi:DNA-binding MarR family transcriptional regulator